MDLSFSTIDTSKCTASLVVHNYETLDVVARFNIHGTVSLPYKAGYLAFREAPILLKLLDLVKKDYVEVYPDVLITDSQGIWHPRGCGLATHFAILSGIPCLGIAKNVLFVEDVSRESVKNTMIANAPNKGDSCKIITGSGKSLGWAYNSTGTITKAIYVSPGSYISMNSCIEITKHMSKYRVVEAVRQADLLSRMFVAI